MHSSCGASSLSLILYCLMVKRWRWRWPPPACLYFHLPISCRRCSFQAQKTALGGMRRHLCCLRTQDDAEESIALEEVRNLHAEVRSLNKVIENLCAAQEKFELASNERFDRLVRAMEQGALSSSSPPDAAVSKPRMAIKHPEPVDQEPMDSEPMDPKLLAGLGGPISTQLAACSVCFRNFALDRLAKHEAICLKLKEREDELNSLDTKVSVSVPICCSN